MPIKPPDGFLTRPEAAKLFNRSQRALERDLNLALTMQDADVLDHWRLITKDGEVRQAADVDTEAVKQLVTDGMTPTWYIEEDWLEREYGRKGTAKPLKSRAAEKSLPQTTPASADAVRQPETGPPPAQPPLQSDVTFLRERIRTLEREKQEEAQRSENREAKLFEQLAVKDKQISAWDEVSQGLTRGLATGQLVPSLTGGRSESAPQQSEQPDVHAQNAKSTPVQEAAVVKESLQTKAKKKPTKKRSLSKRTKKRSQTVFEKHTPTFHKLASGLFHRP